MNIEKDRVAICQASLLLLDWNSEENPKDASFWLGTSIAQGHSLALYRDSQEQDANTAEPGRPNLQRLLWWGILLKECDYCIATGQPPRVSPFGTPMLSLKDFGFEDDGTLAPLDSNQLPRESNKLSCLQALACIKKATLCHHVYRIMRYVHEDNPNSRRPVPRGMCPALRDCLAGELYEWHSNIPDFLDWRTLLRSDAPGPSNRSLAWVMAVIQLIYWTAHIMLYNTKLSPTSGGYGVIVDAQEEKHHPEGDYSLCLLRQSTMEVTEILEKLTTCNLTIFLPPSSLNNVCLIGSSLFREIIGTYEDVHPEHVRKFELCVEASKVMADINPGLRETITALQYMSSVLRRSLMRTLGSGITDLTCVGQFHSGVTDKNPQSSSLSTERVPDFTSPRTNSDTRIETCSDMVSGLSYFTGDLQFDANLFDFDLDVSSHELAGSQDQ